MRGSVNWGAMPLMNSYQVCNVYVLNIMQPGAIPQPAEQQAVGPAAEQAVEQAVEQPVEVNRNLGGVDDNDADM